MATNIKEITSTITPEEIQSIDKVEELMELKKAIQCEREKVEQHFSDLFEKYRERCIDLGVDISPVEDVLADVVNSFETVKTNAYLAQRVAMKEA